MAMLTQELCPRCEIDVTEARVRCPECGQILDFDLSILQRTPPPYRPALTEREIERRLAGERFDGRTH